MTKKQAATAARDRLDIATVVRAAVELLDEKGADAVSVRGTADRLGVRMNTVLWHAKTKARLLELMADAIVAEVALTALPEQWQERVLELAQRYRTTLRGHRDGAALVAGTYAAEPATLRFADTMVQALLEGGLPPREAAWTCWNIVYFVLGLTQEEQALPTADRQHFAEALATGHHPSLARIVEHLDGDSFDERFRYGINRFLAASP
ncbi:MAG TPA: TetR/AcrR family transcriptional regulator C-terminal domain-containing protein [Streptomyces sp.]|nr:TetR/AcrR family transcriptional regulator C-terminal domain-containing protein [Streptomyces sp.]